MSYFGCDPGDMTPEDMYGRDEIPGTPQDADDDSLLGFDLFQSEMMGDETVSLPMIQEAA